MAPRIILPEKSGLEKAKEIPLAGMEVSFKKVGRPRKYTPGEATNRISTGDKANTGKLDVPSKAEKKKMDFAEYSRNYRIRKAAEAVKREEHTKELEERNLKLKEDVAKLKFQVDFMRCMLAILCLSMINVNAPRPNAL